MAYKLADYTVTVLLAMALNSVAYITDAMTGNSLLDSLVKSLLRHTHQLTNLV